MVIYKTIPILLLRVFANKVKEKFLFVTPDLSGSTGLTEDVDGAPGEIRTPDPLVRSQILYPTELQARNIGMVYIRGYRQFQDFYVAGLSLI